MGREVWGKGGIYDEARDDGDCLVRNNLHTFSAETFGPPCQYRKRDGGAKRIANSISHRCRWSGIAGVFRWCCFSLNVCVIYVSFGGFVCYISFHLFLIFSVSFAVQVAVFSLLFASAVLYCCVYCRVLA